MSYQRFVLPVPVALPATRTAAEIAYVESGAGLATVAGHHPESEIRGEAAEHRLRQEPPATSATTATVGADRVGTLAEVATVAGHPSRSGGGEAGHQRHVSQVAPATVATSATVYARPGEPSATSTKPETSPVHADLTELVLQQADPLRCFVCDRKFTVDEAIVAVLTGTPDRRLWLHHRCHDEHIRRCAAARDRAPAPEHLQ